MALRGERNRHTDPIGTLDISATVSGYSTYGRGLRNRWHSHGGEGAIIHPPDESVCGLLGKEELIMTNYVQAFVVGRTNPSISDSFPLSSCALRLLVRHEPDNSF